MYKNMVFVPIEKYDYMISCEHTIRIIHDLLKTDVGYMSDSVKALIEGTYNAKRGANDADN